MKLLLVEDDTHLAKELRNFLVAHKYVLDWAIDQETALLMLEQFEYDLIILDIKLPDGDGKDICQRVRRLSNYNRSTPILLLTAKSNLGDRIAGLKAGADEYLVKPYHPEEFLARIDTLLRRSHNPIQTELTWSELRLDLKNAEVTYQGKLIHLTPKEYQILELFLRCPQKVFSPNLILDRLWSIDEAPTEDAVRTHVKGLRQKLKAAGMKQVPIETVYGFGYRLQPPPKSSASAKILTAVEEAWTKYQWQIGVAIEQFEQFLLQLETNSVDEKKRASAFHYAHRLVGNLGSLGHMQGSTIAREIEQYLQERVFDKPQKLKQLIKSLQKAVKIPPYSAEYSFPEFSSNSPNRVLLVMEEAELTQQLQALEQSQLLFKRVSNFTSAEKLLQAQANYSVVLLDLDLLEGVKWLKKIRQKFPQLEVLVLSSQNDLNLRVEIAQQDVISFFPKPANPSAILQTITKLLTLSTSKTLLVVDDDRQFLALLEKKLSPKLFKLHLLQDPSQFWQLLETVKPDLLLLDIEMPCFKGTDLCQAVRLEQRWRDLPIVAISAYQDQATLNQVLKAGFTSYFPKTQNLLDLVAYLKRYACT